MACLLVWLWAAWAAAEAGAQTVTVPAAVTDTTAAVLCPPGTATYTDPTSLSLAQVTEDQCAASVQGSDTVAGWGSAVVFVLVAFGVTALVIGTAATVKVLWSR